VVGPLTGTLWKWRVWAGGREACRGPRTLGPGATRRPGGLGDLAPGSLVADILSAPR